MVVLSTNYVDGDVFGADTSAGGTKDGLNDITVRLNTHTHDGSDTPVVSSMVCLASGVIPNNGSGYRFSGTSILVPGSYITYKIIGECTGSANGATRFALGMRLNDNGSANMYSYDYFSGAGIGADTTNAFEIFAMNASDNFDIVSFELDILSTSRVSSSDSRNGIGVQVYNHTLDRRTNGGTYAGAGSAITIIDISNSSSFWSTSFLSGGILYLYGIKRV